MNSFKKKKKAKSLSENIEAPRKKVFYCSSLSCLGFSVELFAKRHHDVRDFFKRFAPDERLLERMREPEIKC